MSTLVRLLAAVIGLTAGGLAVFALREATLSTHQPVDPRSSVDVVIEVQTRNRERDQRPAEMAATLLDLCRLEVASDIVGAVDDLGDGRFRATLQPALDQTNRRQFRGCIADWTMDSLQASVVSLEEVAAR